MTDDKLKIKNEKCSCKACFANNVAADPWSAKKVIWRQDDKPRWIENIQWGK